MDRKEQIEGYKSREQVISIIMRLIQAACIAAVLFICVTLADVGLLLWAIILATSVGILIWSSQTYGSSQRLISWYQTIIDQEESKYLRYGDGSKQR